MTYRIAFPQLFLRIKLTQDFTQNFSGYEIIWLLFVPF